MEDMTTLGMRIQRNNNLNIIKYENEKGPGGAFHDYSIYSQDGELLCSVRFQKGPRKDSQSRHGVLESDLLEIVRHRLQSFQECEYRTRENACALTHIEEALMWQDKRVQDRAERNVLGTMEK